METVFSPHSLFTFLDGSRRKGWKETLSDYIPRRRTGFFVIGLVAWRKGSRGSLYGAHFGL